MKKHRNRYIAGIVVLAILALAFWFGGDAPALRGWSFQKAETENTVTKADVQTTERAENVNVSETEKLAKTQAEEPVAQTASAEAPQESKNKTHTCTLSVRCDTVWQNISLLNAEKQEILPQNGLIFAEKTVNFNEGESVFDVLAREMRQNKIHLEFESTALYNSAYIEGIGNLYAFDCGELSGWMYKVNGVFPNYGCSRYILRDGDRVEWVYTCDLGADVGNYGYTGNGD